jgi:hypothetical protein
MHTSPAHSKPVVPALNGMRRRLLLAFGAGGASVATAVPVVAAAKPAIEAGPAHRATGYRVSEHVRNYYQSARR